MFPTVLNWTAIEAKNCVQDVPSYNRKKYGLVCHTARFCHFAEDTLALSGVGALGGFLRARSCSTACMAPLLEMQDTCPASQAPQPPSNSQRGFVTVMGSRAVSKFLEAMSLCSHWGKFSGSPEQLGDIQMSFSWCLDRQRIACCLTSGGFWGWV